MNWRVTFCMVLLGPTDDDADDFAESLIFHTINSTALPLESEHGLRLLLGQDPAHAMTPDNEFAYNPALHLTRLLADRLQGLPQPARQRFGERPLTALWESARNLIAMDEAIASSDIIICDLTGHRPNVYVEAGYALKHHESNRLIFLFEPSGVGDRVPFDLNTFKYVPITQAAEIPNRLTPELESILQSAGALLGGAGA